MAAALIDPALPAALLARVEDAGLNASAPPEQRWLDGWLVRLSAGKAKRARCINPLAPGRLALDERLALARQLYAEASLPLFIRITPLTQPAALDAELAARGLHTIDDTRVMVCRSLADLSAPVLPPGLQLAAVAPAEFAERIGAWRGSPVAQRQVHAARLAGSPVPCAPSLLLRDGEPVAGAQFTREGELVGLYDVFTAPPERGRGLARLLCTTLLAKAREGGARVAYLQVESTNTPARAVYRGLGFTDAYSYHYRADDPAAH